MPPVAEHEVGSHCREERWMESSHLPVLRRWCPSSLLISVLLGTLLLCACTASTAGTASSGGTLRWRFQTDGRMGDLPSVADGVVYFGVQNDAFRGSVYALDASTGVVHWRGCTGGHGAASPPEGLEGAYIGA